MKSPPRSAPSRTASSRRSSNSPSCRPDGPRPCRHRRRLRHQLMPRSSSSPPSPSGLVAARGGIANCHAALAETSKSIPGLRTVGFGDQSDCPERSRAPTCALSPERELLTGHAVVVRSPFMIRGDSLLTLLLFASCGYALWRGRIRARSSRLCRGNIATIFASRRSAVAIRRSKRACWSSTSRRSRPSPASRSVRPVLAAVGRRAAADHQRRPSAEGNRRQLLPHAYGAAVRFWSYPILIILAIGAWRSATPDGAESATARAGLNAAARAAR